MVYIIYGVIFTEVKYVTTVDLQTETHNRLQVD